LTAIFIPIDPAATQGAALARRPPVFESALKAPVLVLVANPNGRKTVLFAKLYPSEIAKVVFRLMKLCV
jgi:hypothetical protein